MRVRVAILGAGGRMGSEVVRAVEADDELELVARIGRGDALETMVDAGAEVAVDFTVPDAAPRNVAFALDHGVHAVVGTTGLGDDVLDDFAARAGAANVVVAPNFALGAVLMMRFAALAAPFFEAAEIVERHHDRKLDAPSGTSLRTAALMGDARGRAWRPGPGERGFDAAGVRIHSLRLPGSVAHQEVLFGGVGETLTIRHDSLDRTSFMPGVVLAVKRVASTPGLTVGLEHLLGV
ncbi:MAG TPA: 4-hydroxy-tetrahydrodipicolinate reductase [Actinomycetota bacterium]|nr:4-hydroxy-tetrahydrodipicolinate reductase [Actinomycetota bacterium]